MYVCIQLVDLIKYMKVVSTKDPMNKYNHNVLILIYIYGNYESRFLMHRLVRATLADFRLDGGKLLTSRNLLISLFYVVYISYVLNRQI